MMVVDVSITHPPSSTNLAATAQTDEAAAAKRDDAKHRAYKRLEPHGYPFVPFTVEPMVVWANLRFASWLAWARRPRSPPEEQASLALWLGLSGS
jgi:hypothetical protein